MIRCRCKRCRAVSPRPEQVGDAHGVVVEIALDREGLEWLAYELPQHERLAKDLHAVVERLDRLEAVS